jgi:hypothetical protein
METVEQLNLKARPLIWTNLAANSPQCTQFQDSGPDPGVELGFWLDLPDLDAILRDSSGFTHQIVRVRTDIYGLITTAEVMLCLQ